MTTVEAIYEKGVFKPKEPVELAEGEHVTIYIAKDEPITESKNGGKTLAEIMEEIAVQSNPVKPGDENASVEHDKYLYGWDKA